MEKRYDVIIVGSGLAGLYSALTLPADKKVCVISKTQAISGSSKHAQGGIAAAIDSQDSPQEHTEDTLAVGYGLNDVEAVNVLTHEGVDCVKNLVELGVPFNKVAGALSLHQEAAHNKRRILHAGGDATGVKMVETLYHLLRQRPNITFMEKAFVHEVLVKGKTAYGVRLWWGETPMTLLAPAVILASGGIGQVYTHTTNPIEATGDGIALAQKAGAKLKEMAFVQFHPTALNVESEDGALPLLTEALRGEGAYLLNEQHKRFIDELAPRDMVARAVWAEIDAGKNVFLDVRHVAGRRFAQTFPTVYGSCIKAGLNPLVDILPVVPAAHYFMGGVKSDINGRTNIKGLWVCGEVACTGVHGANRLASNSMLECLVFARRVAKNIAIEKFSVVQLCPAQNEVSLKVGVDKLKKELRQIMSAHVGLIRTEEGLVMAIAQLEKLGKSYKQMPAHKKEVTYQLVRENSEFLNMLSVAQQIIKDAVQRPKSCGAHYRADDISQIKIGA